MSTSKIAFIGSGNMANSLVGGLVADDYDPDCVFVAGPSQAKLDLFSEKYNVRCTQNNQTAAENSDVIVLCVKPQTIHKVVAELADVIAEKEALILSIAAGIRCENIEQWLKAQPAIVRCMPNTPALLGVGATALYANKKVTEAQQEMAESIMRSVGTTLWLDDEHLLDVVTALSGSGPAYFFLIIESMQEAAIALGLPEKAAKLLTLQTALGAARMAFESTDSADILRERVTSPGGTTEKALEVLQAGHIKELFAEAIKQASIKAEQLSQQRG